MTLPDLLLRVIRGAGRIADILRCTEQNSPTELPPVPDFVGEP
jgi:hypothetical protein